MVYAALLHDRDKPPPGYEPPARYPVWENSPNPFAQPQDYIKQVRMRKLHLMRPDLIPYPLYIETYA